MNLAEKLLNQHKERVEHDFSGGLPQWAITMCEESVKANPNDALVRVRVVESFLTDSPYLKDLKLSCGHTKLSHPIRGNKIPNTVVCWDCSGTPA